MHRYLDEATTCRQLIYDAISDAAYASIRGSPWAVEVEVALVISVLQWIMPSTPIQC